MLKKEYPQVHYYDQDFVDIYERSWAWMSDCWKKPNPSIGLKNSYFAYHNGEEINLAESCMASFFLVYFNKKFPVNTMLDNFYSMQEESGAIRCSYSLSDGAPILTEGNPEGFCPPLLAWTEYNLYHKVGAKIRIKNIMKYLTAYHNWLEASLKQENGLYAPPREACMMLNTPLDSMWYPLTFNSHMALNALYMSALADILNDKELAAHYKRQYYSLKTRINSKMWNNEDRCYYDLDKEENQIKVKTIATFWPLLAEIPNDDKAEGLFDHLKNPETFGTENPFPTLAVNEKDFDENGCGFRGSVMPSLTYMVIKGLEKYKQYEFAREAAIRHLYYIIDTFHTTKNQKGTLWQAYKPCKEGPAVWDGNEEWNKPLNLAHVGLATIALMIENIVGLFISLPRKTVVWFVPTLELMGIEDLPLKRNHITIISKKSTRGWEIRLESEKLYYFSIHLLEEGKKKTLPIPSGKCSMLIDKL